MMILCSMCKRPSQHSGKAEVACWSCGTPGRYRVLTKKKDVALAEFISAIDAVGGIVKEESGFYAPACDVMWIDLGEAYLKACTALGVEPLTGEITEDPDSE